MLHPPIGGAAGSFGYRGVVVTKRAERGANAIFFSHQIVPSLALSTGSPSVGRDRSQLRIVPGPILRQPSAESAIYPPKTLPGRRLSLNEMSGIEFIVSTVLASVPITLEAYDRSGRVFEVFSAIRHYQREIRILEAKLGVQRTIFRNYAINLLTAITKDRVKVQEVMNHPASQNAIQALSMASIYRQRIDALDESFNACRRMAEQIRNSLQDLCIQCEIFRAEVGEKQDMSATEWLKHVGARLKLGLNKPQLIKAIEELRGFNQDFGSITEQIAKALGEILGENRGGSAVVGGRPVKKLNLLQGYHRARYASKALYSTLQVRWACSSHPCHLFSVRILDRDLDRNRGKGKSKASLTPHITWELTIAHDGSSYASEGPLRLEIEQDCESDDEDASPHQDAMENTAAVQQLTSVLEINSGPLKLEMPTTKTRKAARFSNMSEKVKQQQQQQQQPGPSNFAATMLPSLTNSLATCHIDGSPQSTVAASNAPADLALVKEFCKKFHEATADCIGRSFIGFWKGPPASAQWFSVPPRPQTTVGTPQPLSDMIRWIAEEPVLRSLSRQLLVELASNVAEGIMQFYSTPWLAPANLAQNLYYFNPAGSGDTGIHLEGPYFTVRLDSTTTKARTHPGFANTSLDSPTVLADSGFTEARNQLLFNFGVLLLEISYGRPWHDLKRSVAKMPVAAGKRLGSDYRAAETLAQLLVNQMGLTYPKIIKKCLGCDFGLGETDLDNEELQRRFIEDIVLGLRQLREQIRELDFALLV